MIDIKMVQNLGFSANEARIYLAALELGTCLPLHLAVKAGIKRPTLYKILPELFRKGVLSETMIGRRRYLVAEDPEQYLDKKRSEFEYFTTIIPDLRSLMRTASVKPVIVFYEGIEGLKKVYLDNLRARKETLNYIGLEKIHPEIEDYTHQYYVPERVRRKISIRVLVSGPREYGRLNLTTDLKYLREVKIIDSKKYPFPLDAYIYGETVSFIMYREDSEPVGVIIRSREISIALRSLFELAWQA